MNIGDVIDDFIIIDRIGVAIIVKCLVCGRVQKLSSLATFKKRNNTHGNICSKIVCRDNNKGSNADFDRFYSIWCNMRTRTTNPKYEKWNRYGGRGINSSEFVYFVDFYDKMYNSYISHCLHYGRENTTIERINNNDNYCEQNCTWATWYEQAGNKERLLNIVAINIKSGVECSWNNLKQFCEMINADYRKTYLQMINRKNGIMNFDNWLIKCND